jgi:hypothetical protein
VLLLEEQQLLARVSRPIGARPPGNPTDTLMTKQLCMCTMRMPSCACGRAEAHASDRDCT